MSMGEFKKILFMPALKYSKYTKIDPMSYTCAEGKTPENVPLPLSRDHPEFYPDFGTYIFPGLIFSGVDVHNPP